MTAARRLCLLLCMLALAAAGTAAAPAAAQDGAEPPGPVYEEWEWADADAAAIHPGVQTVVEGAQCTSNFVFVQVDGDGYLVDVLLGFAGHCAASTGNADECQDEAYPVGHPVEVQGADHQATVAYNATLTMIRVGETDSDTCFNNDFGLVRLHRDDWARVNPSLPEFGGPLGVNTTGTTEGEEVYAWGNSGLRFGVEETNPKRGVSLGTDSAGWNHNVYTVTPGVPGDSGSGYLDADGHALGVVSTVEFALFPGSNNIVDLDRALRYAVEHEPELAQLRLERGTEPFDPSWPLVVSDHASSVEVVLP